MPVRSTAFGTLTMVACCLLPTPEQQARANTAPARSAHHHKPATPTVTAVQLPVFQAGLWQYRRTVVKYGSPRPQVSMLRQCADPSTEIREKMARLQSGSCQFAPLARQRNRYLARWTCQTPMGPMNFRSVLIAKGATSYEDLNEMRSAQSVIRQKLEAVRIGECPARGGSPMSPNAGPMPRT